MSFKEKISVLISSRTQDPVSFHGARATLSDVRQELKEKIESERLFGEDTFEVWINEQPPGGVGAESNWWEECLDRVRKADIVLVIYNGRAGTTRGGSPVGICHAEYKEALEVSGRRTRIIELDAAKGETGSPADQEFQRYVASERRFHLQVKTGDEVIAAGCRAVRDAVAEMVELGNRAARRTRFLRGRALDWSKRDLRTRMGLMCEAAREALAAEPGSAPAGDAVVLSLADTPVLWAVHAIPGSPSLAAARELVGRPHLLDHTWQPLLEGDRGGPVHVVVCQKGVTENQAMAILGFPDATFVQADFGVYVADEVQKAQLLFVKDCRDADATQMGIRNLLDWLVETGEDRTVAERARARRLIVQAIADVQDMGKRPAPSRRARKG